jgi:hypothetical protein
MADGMPNEEVATIPSGVEVAPHVLIARSKPSFRLSTSHVVPAENPIPKGKLDNFLSKWIGSLAQDVALDTHLEGTFLLVSALPYIPFAKQASIRTGARPITRSPDNMKLLTHKGEFHPDINDDYRGVNDVDASCCLIVRSLLSDNRTRTWFLRAYFL